MNALKGWGFGATELKTRSTSAGSRGAPATVSSEGRCAGVGRARYFTKHGLYTGLRELARQTGVPVSRLRNRVKYGYTREQAVAMELYVRRKKVPEERS